MRPILASLLLTMAPACTGEHHDGGNSDEPPAAPSGLTITEVSGGAHLVWMDNADNEDHYMVLRRADGETEFDEIATPTFDAEQYHDGSVTSGAAYVYKVVAMNAAGAAESDEVEFTAP